MLNTHIKTSLRTILKHKWAAFVNIFGLAIAMAAALFILYYVQYQNSFDSFWANAGNTYRLSCQQYQNGQLTINSAKSLVNMAPILKTELPEIKAACQIYTDQVIMVNTKQRVVYNPTITVADSTFQSVFDFKYINKSSNNPLAELYGSVMSASMAKQLFGTENAVGLWYELGYGWPFKVTGVFADLPQNSHITFNLLLSIQTYWYLFQNWDVVLNKVVVKNPKAHIATMPTNWDWGYNGTYTYLVLKPNLNSTQLLQKINRLSNKYASNLQSNGSKIKFNLMPMRNIHLQSNYNNEIHTNGSKHTVTALTILAWVILCIAWVNYINMALAQTINRAKETALRKLLGAKRYQLVIQYFFQHSIINLMAIGMALIVIELFKPYVSELIGANIALSLFNTKAFWLQIGGLFLVGSVISGVYPAWLQSSFKTNKLASNKKTLSLNNLRLQKILVIGQFAAAIVLIIGVTVIYKQITFMQNQNLGANINKTIVTYTPASLCGRPNRIEKLDTYKMQIKNLPEVDNMTVSSSIPSFEIVGMVNNVYAMGQKPSQAKSYIHINTDVDFLKTFKIKLIDGHFYSGSIKANEFNIVINLEALKTLGFKSSAEAINNYIIKDNAKFKIIGVIDNYHHQSLKMPVKPTLYFCNYIWINDVGFYSIKLNTGNMALAISKIKKIWESCHPIEPFRYFVLDTKYNHQYQADINFGKMFAILSLLCVVIACMGLQALTAYITINRTKEIGIRKAAGSTTKGIVGLLLKKHLTLVLVAYIIACPVAYLIMHKWLQTFAYKTSMNIYIFILAGIVAVSIAIATVFWQAWQAARRNPVSCLRYE